MVRKKNWKGKLAEMILDNLKLSVNIKIARKKLLSK